MQTQEILVRLDDIRYDKYEAVYRSHEVGLVSRSGECMWGLTANPSMACLSK